MRFLATLTVSLMLHGFLLWAFEASAPPVVMLKRGEFCVEVHASFSSRPSPAREAPSTTASQSSAAVSVKQTPAEQKPEKIPLPTLAEPLPQPTPLHQPQNTDQSKDSKVVDRAAVVPPPPPMVSESQDEQAKQAEKQPVKTRNMTDEPASLPSPASVAAMERQAGVLQGASLYAGYKPEYPYEARVRGIQGRVLLRIAVSDEGRASEVEILESSGYEILDAAAAQFARDVPFQPARRHGKPIAAEVSLPVIYRLR